MRLMFLLVTNLGNIPGMLATGTCCQHCNQCHLAQLGPLLAIGC